MRRRGQAQIGHQLPPGLEAVEIPDLGLHRHRHDEGDPAHRLMRRVRGSARSGLN